MKIKFVISFFFALILMVPVGALAQSDGGGKKKNSKTVQTASPKGAAKQGKRNNSVVKLSRDGEINGHAYVDLGLPSGLKWATCNINASSPSDFGSYFRWGETECKSKTKADNLLSNRKTDEQLFSEGIIDSNGIITMKHDAANTNWGSSWRLPTKEDFEELVSNCKWEWIRLGGHNGCLGTGPNGKTIFFPATGDSTGESIYNAEELAMYWSSTPGDLENKYPTVLAYFMSVQKEGPSINTTFRSGGEPVRPVSK